MKIRFLIHLTKSMTVLMILLTVSSLQALAQTYTLEQILDSIRAHNPGLQQFAWETAASIAEAEGTEAWMAPSAAIGLDEFPYAGGKTMAGSGMPRKMLMLRLEQMFPNFSRQKKESAYHLSMRQQHDDDSATMANRLFAMAKSAYYDAYVAEKKLAAARQQQKQLTLLIQLATGRLQYNEASPAGLYKARARLADLKALEVQLQSLSSQAGAVLSSLMNRHSPEPLRVDTESTVTHLRPPILGVDTAYMLTHRSDIMRTSDEIRSLQLNRQVLSAGAEPVFGLHWDNMRMDGGGYMYSLMASVSIPIAPWFSKGYRSKSRAIGYRIQAMRKMQENRALEAVGRVRKDWIKLQAARSDLRIFEREVIPAYAQTFRAYLNAYGENTAGIFETLAAWNELTAKKMDYWDKVSRLLHVRTLLETEMQLDKEGN